ncbi:hypothetical protein [Bradyrhizobium prioriisuperbiae]|uniref:hypothetical protein n=1 Tax=Bradyrhizobium prioriisuperbiae TaxID=2854389 RepID=UPI0028EFE4A6|nr:hypothetical protein [Bradyrhizobium prioritasuperba]
MTANPVELITGIVTATDVVKPDFVAWAKARVPQVMASVTEIRNTNLAGQLMISLNTSGYVYLQDTADTSTPDDGVNCIVSADGRRFKIVPYFLNGISMSGAAPISGTFGGGGLPAKFWLDLTGDASSTTLPTIGGQFLVRTNKGGSDPHNVFTVGIYGGVYGTLGHGDLYGGNTNASGVGGTGGKTIVGFESDVNNNGADADTIGDTGQVIGCLVSTGSSKRGTVGFQSTATQSYQAWNFGFAAVGEHKEAGFLDQSNAIHVLRATNLHSAGIDFTGASFISSVGIALGNSHVIQSKDTGGTLRSMIWLDNANLLNLGGAGIGYINANQAILPSVDNSFVMGNVSNRWSAIYAANGTIQTSDLKDKDDRAPITGEIALAILKDVAADPDGVISFRWKIGGNEMVEHEVDEERHLSENVTETYFDIEERPDGSCGRVEKTRIVQRPLYDVVPVTDQYGQQITETIPARVLHDLSGAVIKVLQPEEIVSVTYKKPRMGTVTIKKLLPVEREGRRRHAGWGAQVWRDVLAKHGLDIGLLVKNDPTDPESRLALRPDQVSPLLHVGVVELEMRLATALKRIEALEKR